MRARRKAQTSRRARAPRSRPHAPPPPLRLCAVRVGWPAAAMSANLEEQEMELEALESIFMDDLRVVDATGEEGVGVECRCGAGQEGEARAVMVSVDNDYYRITIIFLSERHTPTLHALGIAHNSLV